MRYIFVKINIIIYLQVVELIPFLQHSQPKIPKFFSSILMLNFNC
jgi:hypothetical protein